MLTYTYISKGTFGLVEKPKPTIQHERDAIVKVTLASICSSDLHIKHGTIICRERWRELRSVTRWSESWKKLARRSCT